MGRLVRISIYALVIFILYFWVTVLVKSYQKSKVNISTTGLEADSTYLDSLYQDSVLHQTTEMIETNDGKTISNEDIVDGVVDSLSLIHISSAVCAESNCEIRTKQPSTRFFLKFILN